jgi:UDP-glucose 4-epimerase
MSSGGDPQPVAVTGAGGLIGTRVVAELHRRGNAVRGLVGAAGEPAPALPGYWRWGDIRDVEVVADVLRGSRAVIHLAGPSVVPASFADPAGSVATHAAGTAVVLQVAVAEGLPRLCLASSAEVYGDPDGDADERDPLQPLSPYAVGKVAAEQLAGVLARCHRIGLTVLRPFAVYGPQSPARSLVGRVVRQAGTDSLVQVRDLTRERDFVQVDDVARAFVDGALRPGLPTALTANVCTGRGTSVLGLARAALLAAGVPEADQAGRIRVALDPVPPGSAGSGSAQSPSRQPESPSQPGSAPALAGIRPGWSDPVRLVGRPDLAAATLGWTARTDLAAGLAECLAALRQSPLQQGRERG